MGKGKWAIYVVLLTILTLSVACAPAASPTPVATGDFKFPDSIRIVTTSPGGAGYAMMAAVAPLMEKEFGVPIRLMPSDAALVRFGMIRDLQAPILTAVPLGDGIAAAEGRGYFAAEGWGPQEISIAWFNYTSPVGIMVRGDSDIKTVKDLKGKRMVWRPESPGMIEMAEGALAFAGYTTKDVQLVNISGYDACFRAVAEGRADFVVIYTYSGITYEVAEGPHGIRWIPMPLEDKEGWARYTKIDLAGAGAVNSKGVQSSIGVPMIIGSTPIFAYSNADGELIYRMAKFLGEKHDSYKSAHQMAEEMSIKYVEWFKGVSPLPFHSGLIRYLKEKGIWTTKDDMWNGERVDWFTLYKTAWQQATADAKGKGVRIHPDDKDWISLWDNYRKGLPRFGSRV